MILGYKKQGIQLYGQQNINFVTTHPYKHKYTFIHVNSTKTKRKYRKILTVISG